MADTCVARVPVFAALSPRDQERVAALARPVRLAAGRSAYASDDAPAQLMVVHTGRLRLARLAPDGAEQLLRVLGPGEFTGEVAVFSGERRDDRATAVDDCTLCVFRHDDLARLVREHPELGLRLLAAVSRRLAATEDRLHAVTSRDVGSRLADYLLGLPSAWADGVATVRLPLAKKDVASLLDTSPESLSRALASLAARGLVAVGAGRAVAITDPDGLQRLADGA
ncbi:Crp/Fnr family transcriptional regulator [Actinotalea solisilvae]|uniref:Crp/Fnr family transcriptional regulator n=1 Tax=Actinotalea solisilvae TaxID=2072922 RepID=UPI0018F216E3|nr:Crp/Fnr family transcriptional regulator [Actinotalea solisilvae]